MVIIGIHSTADSMGNLMKLLVDDTELKTLMKISVADQSNYKLLTTKYIQSTFISDTILTEPICVLLVRDTPQSQSNNEFVKFDGVIIEIYVHSSIDTAGTAGINGFKRRTHMIADRLVQLLHRQYLGSDLYKLVDKNELQSATPNFRRYYVRFEYKAVYA